jgi:hypothetical protein
MERLHKLLRGEHAAVESYELALEDVTLEPARALMQTLLADHRRAVSVLARHVALAGERPDRGSGAWGAFARAVETAASWIGDAHALKALKEGEVHGLSEYNTALASGQMPPALQVIVEDELLPRQEAHIAQLDRLIARIEGRDARKGLADRIEDADRSEDAHR